MQSPSHANALPSQIAIVSSQHQKNKPDEEDEEDDDIDFNPLLQQTLSPEASSSLSSEAEPDPIQTPIPTPQSPQSKPDSTPNLPTRSDNRGDEDEDEEEEESVMQSNSETRVSEERKSLGQEYRTEEVQEEEEAICRRTRARYSLENFSLDVLESFLQETDDEDDLHNVDDEAEYRKFLAAVLQDGDGGGGEAVGSGDGGGEEDDDEENDADFEVEIEEALMESDADESNKGKKGREESDGGRGELRRPETRQKRRQKDSPGQSGRKLLGQAKIPLRPLLPLNGDELQRLPQEGVLHCPPSMPQFGQLGFTASQIGQLHCLIHEHVQLLVQVYTLCISESSKHHIACDAQKMMLELVCKRDEALAWRKHPYPGFCFQPPYVQPSVAEEHPRLRSLCSFNASDVHKDCSDVNTLDCNTIVSHQAAPPAAHLGDQNFHGTDIGRCPNAEDSIWTPHIRGPVMSILDVAPLSLVGRYMTDVSLAMQEFNQRRVGNGYDTSHFEREPLFPFPHVSTQTDATNNEDVRGLAPIGSDADPSHLTGQVQHEPKKSLAAALVESTKKQSVALVPREIVNLARRFFPLFNIALFPHKPPSPAVANRVLFTDAEDGLLAMGLMEYNNDWKAIQQRFLPCKSENQIFVRQKNRSSSKAPENPIKAVRRMKTSPLTAEEQARIHEGLKVYKLDWMSVWKFFVPYRDPSLLPRQWRIALGTQKSYKTSEAAKAKRRVYESMRRKSKKGATNWRSVAENEVDNADGGNNSADGNMDDEDEAYVHEAFLAEWTPRNSKLMPSELPFSSVSNGNLQSGVMLPQQGMQIAENRFDGMGEYGESGPMHGFMAASKFSGDLQRVSQFTYHQFSASYAANQQAPNWKSKSSCSQFNLRPYRMRKNNIVKCVKLAPDLPPVNLPPSVRVISQSAFKSYQCESSISRIRAGTENPISSLPSVAKSGATTVNAGRNRNAVPKITGKSSHSQDPRTTIQPSTEDSGAESDLQMHPLLFQAPEDGCLPYSLMNYSNSSSSTFSFFLGTPLQTNLDLLSKSQQAGSAVDHFHPALRSKEAPSNLCTIDFHPLLQSADSINCDPEPLQGTCVQIPNPSNSSLSAPMAIDTQWATNTTLTSPYEKANELDLDIHLSSAASREVMGRRQRFEHRSNGSSTRAREDGTIEESQQEESRTKADSSTHVMDAHELVLSSNGISRLTEDNLDEQSNPGIVMEQEELSDSDEDVGDVEFECEEMADSEGEGLGYRELDNLQNKELPSVALEEERNSTDVNNGSESILMRCDPKKNIVVGNSNAYSQKLVLTAKSKNIGTSTQSNSGSCTLGPSSSTLKRERRNRGYRDAGSVVQSRPVRSSKRKPNVDRVAVRSQEVPQLVLNPTTAECSTTITSTKKPKKRGCRLNPEGVEMGNYKHVSSENMVDHPDDCGMRDGQKMLNPTPVDPFPPNAKEQTDT